MSQEPTTVTELWDVPYPCFVPYLRTCSVERLTNYGVHHSGVKELDDNLHKQEIKIAIPIVKMIEYYEDGIPIKLCRKNDGRLIYEAISAHINAWRKRVETGINVGAAPYDDLIKMDEFANTVYNHGSVFAGMDKDSVFSQKISSFFSHQISNIFKQPTQNAKVDSKSTNGTVFINGSNVTGDLEIPERESLADFFKNKAANSFY